MTEVAEKLGFEERIEKVRDAVGARLDMDSDWVVFYREVLGLGGLLDKIFTEVEREQFEQTDEFAKIQQALAKLREKSKLAKDQYEESTRVITVRLPKSLHESLRDEAYRHKTSMNQLCISKLLQVIDGELVPSDVQPSETERGTRRRSSRRAQVEATPAVEVQIPEPPQAPEPEPSPMAVGGMSYATSYSDHLTGGRPF